MANTVDLGELQAIIDEHGTDTEDDAERQRLQGHLDTIAKRRAEIKTEDKQLEQSARIAAGKLKKLGATVNEPNRAQEKSATAPRVVTKILRKTDDKPRAYDLFWSLLVGVVISIHIGWLISNTPLSTAWLIGILAGLLVTVGMWFSRSRLTLGQFVGGVVIDAIIVLIAAAISGFTGLLGLVIGMLVGFIVFCIFIGVSAAKNKQKAEEAATQDENS